MITQILERWKDGDQQASAELFELVYCDLKILAQKQMASENVGHTLQPTALVNELYVKLFSTTESRAWNSRRHFFGVASEAMRNILVDHARGRARIKRGGEFEKVQLHENIPDMPNSGTSVDVLEVHEALAKLEALDGEKAELVKLRYFCGLSLVEAAEILGVSRATAARLWTFTKAWLNAEISKKTEAPD